MTKKHLAKTTLFRMCISLNVHLPQFTFFRILIFQNICLSEFTFGRIYISPKTYFAEIIHIIAQNFIINRMKIIKSNQIFHYTRWITPKRVTSWRGPSPHHCARATQLLSKKRRSGGEPLATLCPI